MVGGTGVGDEIVCNEAATNKVHRVQGLSSIVKINL